MGKLFFYHSPFDIPLLCKVLIFYVDYSKMKQTISAVDLSEADQRTQHLMMYVPPELQI